MVGWANVYPRAEAVGKHALPGLSETFQRLVGDLQPFGDKVWSRIESPGDWLNLDFLFWGVGTAVMQELLWDYMVCRDNKQKELEQRPGETEQNIFCGKFE